MSGLINGAGSRSGVIGTTELDYEEGLFLVPASTSAGAVPSYGENSSHYTKIGNSITVYYFYIIYYLII